MEDDLFSVTVDDTPPPAAIDGQPGGRLLGFAVVDQQPDDPQIAVWLVSLLSPTVCDATNAVVIDSRDSDAAGKLDALTHHRLVVTTEGSAATTPGAVPISELADRFTDAVTRLQTGVLAAVAAHRKATGNNNLTIPEFGPTPTPAQVAGVDGAAGRALSAANHVKGLWGWWLSADEERRRRTGFPSFHAAGLDVPEVRMLPPTIGIAGA